MRYCACVVPKKTHFVFPLYQLDTLQTNCSRRKKRKIRSRTSYTYTSIFVSCTSYLSILYCWLCKQNRAGYLKKMQRNWDGGTTELGWVDMSAMSPMRDAGVRVLQLRATGACIGRRRGVTISGWGLPEASRPVGRREKPCDAGLLQAAVDEPPRRRHGAQELGPAAVVDIGGVLTWGRGYGSDTEEELAAGVKDYVTWYRDMNTGIRIRWYGKTAFSKNWLTRIRQVYV
jgi:hypothetical protein